MNVSMCSDFFLNNNVLTVVPVPFLLEPNCTADTDDVKSPGVVVWILEGSVCLLRLRGGGSLEN